MDEWDWFVVIGYVLVATAFSVTLYASIMHVVGQRRSAAEMHAQRWRYNIISALIAAVWPISLPIAAVLATASIMAGRKR